MALGEALPATKRILIILLKQEGSTNTIAALNKLVNGRLIVCVDT